MSEKTYIVKGEKEPEFVIVPHGKFNEKGTKMKRVAIKFHRNQRGEGQFSTSDLALQKHLEEHSHYKTGKMVCLEGKLVAPPKDANDKPAQKPGPKTSNQ